MIQYNRSWAHGSCAGRAPATAAAGDRVHTPERQGGDRGHRHERRARPEPAAWSQPDRQATQGAEGGWLVLIF